MPTVFMRISRAWKRASCTAPAPRRAARQCSILASVPAGRQWLMRNTILTLLNRKLTDRYHASGHWRVDTIYALASGHAQRSPTRPAARDRFRRVRCGELVAAADALSESLARHGVRPGVLGGEGASEASRERGCRLTIRRSDIPLPR